MRIFLLYILIVFSIKSFAQKTKITGSCAGSEYILQLKDNSTDSVEQFTDGYFRDIYFKGKKGVLSISCMANTVPGTLSSNEYILLYDSLNVRSGVVEKYDSNIEREYIWKEIIIRPDLWINYICEDKDEHIFEEAINSFTLLPHHATINGIATDGKGNPLNGCNVIIKGTKKGTLTNQCGEFKLKVVKNSTTTIVFHDMTYFDLRAFEIELPTDRITTNPIVFKLMGGVKKNQNCKRVNNDLTTYIID